MSDRCYTHKARSCRKCDTVQKHTIELTETERAAVDRSLADTGCYGFAGDHPDLYVAVARIKAEAVQAERERIARGES